MTETDALAGLEERILRAVELVAELRRDNAALEARLREADAGSKGAIEKLESENERLHEELAALREERKEVRARVEKLLSQLDALAG
jgi:hypothetical protein